MPGSLVLTTSPFIEQAHTSLVIGAGDSGPSTNRVRLCSKTWDAPIQF